MKGLDLLTRSARLAGMLASGETLSGTLPSEMLVILQDMMDEWQADGLKIFAEGSNRFPLVNGTQTYQLGLGVAPPGFNMQRPAKIQRMGVEILSNPAQPVELPMNVLDYEEWALIRVKLISGSYPLNCFPDYAFPNMNLNFWVIPTIACNVIIYSWNPLSTFPDLAVTDVTFPPAYNMAIKNNLAVLIASEYKTPIDPTVVAIATNSLKALKDINLPSSVLGFEGGLSSGAAHYDWRSDSYVNRR